MTTPATSAAHDASSGFGWILGSLGGLLLLGLFFGKFFWGSPPPAPTSISYHYGPPAAAAPAVAAPATPTPTPAPLFGTSSTVVHHYAAVLPAPPAIPFQFHNAGYQVEKRCGWTAKVGGFTIVAPANTRDSLNAQTIGMTLQGQQNVAHHWAQQEAAKNPPVKTVTRTVTVPVIVDRPVAVPVYPYRRYYPWW